MSEHAQLTASDIRGPYSQLLTNLAGKNGAEWLEALDRFLRKENPWGGKDLTAVFIRRGWTLEQIDILQNSGEIVELQRRMFSHPPALDSSIKDFFSEEMGIQTRTRIFNFLDANGFKTVGDVVVKTEDDLLRIPNLGRKCVVAIKEKLARSGLRLGMRVD